MKKLWTALAETHLTASAKSRWFIALMVIGTSALGGILWLLFGRIFLAEVSWLLCFIGYPGVFWGFFGSVVYLYNHEFV